MKYIDPDGRAFLEEFIECVKKTYKNTKEDFQDFVTSTKNLLTDPSELNSEFDIYTEEQGSQKTVFGQMPKDDQLAAIAEKRKELVEGNVDGKSRYLGGIIEIAENVRQSAIEIEMGSNPKEKVTETIAAIVGPYLEAIQGAMDAIVSGRRVEDLDDRSWNIIITE